MNQSKHFNKVIKQNAIATPSLIPAEYQQVEYIWGTQCYIDTEISNQIPIEFECVAKSYSGISYVFGAFTDNNRMLLQMFTTSGNTCLGYGGYTLGSKLTRNQYYKLNGVLHNGQQTLYVDDVQDINATLTANLTDMPLYLFGCNRGKSVYPTIFAGEMKYLKLWSNGTLIFDGIPCYRKSDDRAGFYDLVSEQLFDSYSSSNFGKGADV